MTIERVGDAPRRTRPPDRRDRVIAAATELFYRDGYPAVSMGDVAAAVGVRPSALYRHVTGKQDLLLAAVRASLEAGVEIATAEDRGLAEVLRALCAAALDHRHLGVLWQRESRHLTRDQRNELGSRVRIASASLRDGIASHRPELDRHQAAFLAECVFAVPISVSYQRVEMPRAAYAALLHDMTMAVVRADVPSLAGGPRPRSAGFGLSSRREMLMAAAADQFAARGFDEVAVDDIAAAAGIAAPSFYHHFKGKADVLWAILLRGDQAIRADLTRTLRAAHDPSDALRRAAAAYIALALDSPELIEAMVWQIPHLPSDRRVDAAEIQRDLLDEWLALLAGARPDLDRASSRVLIQAVLTIINDIAMTPRLRVLPGVGHALAAVVDALVRPPSVGGPP